jgi:hypothetical protein
MIYNLILTATRMASLHFAIIFALFSTVGIVGAQTNMIGVSIGDIVPVDGVGDNMYIPLLVAGEADGSWGPSRGLYRSELLIQLPALPPACSLASAQLNLYLEENSGTPGLLNVYHNLSRNSISLDSADYSDPAYSLVGALVTSNSPAGHYYAIDVTSQVAKDYETSSPVAAFRLQVDGLNYTGGSHYYRFFFASQYPAYPIYLNLVIAMPTALPPSFGLFRVTPSSAIVHWPTNATDYTLESADSPLAPTWTAVTNETATIGDQFAFTIFTTKAAQFFRIHQK